MTSESDVLQVEIDDHVSVLTLNRPESMNAMNAALHARLREELARIRDDDDIRVGVLTGNGRAFCAGADLKERAAAGAGAGGGAGDGTAAGFFSTTLPDDFATFDTRKPMIAAVNGYCLAGGFELALTCDIRVAVEGAQFGVPEITRGFFPGGGAPQRLPRMMPRAVAMELLLTGDSIDADTALRYGLVSHVVERDALMPTALSIAKRIASHAPLAVRAARELARASDDMTLSQALRFGSSLRWIIGRTEDAVEGPRAFTEKREPEYRGR